MDQPTAYIVTGTTRGIGKCLAAAVTARGHRLYSISRGPNLRKGNIINHNCDLRDSGAREAAMSAILSEIPYPSISNVVLINNAAVLSPIAAVHLLTSERIETHVQVNFIAPLHLMALFLSNTDSFQGHRRVLNMVSGAARHAYAGWALYCSAKSALLMATRCAALEQNRFANGASVFAVAPGVVATDMQATIRAADETDFPLRSKFVEMQAAGRLLDPNDVAVMILDLDQNGKFHSGGFYDLRDVVQTDQGPTIAPRPVEH